MLAGARASRLLGASLVPCHCYSARLLATSTMLAGNKQDLPVSDPSSKTSILNASKDFSCLIDACLDDQDRLLVERARSLQVIANPNDPMVDFSDLLNQVEQADKFLSNLEVKSDEILRQIDDMLLEVETEWKDEVGDETEVLSQDNDLLPSKKDSSS